MSKDRVKPVMGRAQLPGESVAECIDRIMAKIKDNTFREDQLDIMPQERDSRSNRDSWVADVVKGTPESSAGKGK